MCEIGSLQQVEGSIMSPYPSGMAISKEAPMGKILKERDRKL